MNRFDPLRDDLNEITTKLLISASAGTGKTWTITHLASRWLVETDGHRTDQILMVTFSRAAAAELKSRLRERLSEYADALIAVDVAHSPGFTASERQLILLQQPWVAALEPIVLEQGIEVLLERQRHAMATLDEVNARTIHSFAAMIGSGVDAVARSSSRLVTRAVNEVLVRESAGATDEFSTALASIDSTSPMVTLRKVLNEAHAVVGSLGGIHSPVVELLTSQPPTDLEQYVVRLLGDVERRVERIRSLEGVVTYDALISDLYRDVLVDPDAVRARVNGQFELVLIDEFQDTDAAQWAIFDTLFQRGARVTPVIAVGDPKQAIYGFRGGDVNVFQHVSNEIARDPRAFVTELRENYRSQGGLLHRLNGLFSQAADRGWNFADDGAGGVITYHDVEATAARRDHNGVFELRDLRGVASRDDDNNELLTDLWRVVTELTTSNLDEPGAPVWELSDIVILSRRGYIIDQIQRFFERRGITTVTLKSSPVFKTTAATQLRTLLWALAEATDPRRVGILEVSWFASWAARREWNMSDVVLTMENNSIGALHRSVMDDELLELLLRHPQGLRHWTDLDHLFDMLADEFASGASALEALEWLEANVIDAREDSDSTEGQRRIESDANAVRIMTIHAAKGLEFPVVLVADIESGTGAGGGANQRVLSTYATRERRVIDLSASLDASPVSPRVQQARNEESRRLIYVALTRAREVLVAWIGDRHQHAKGADGDDVTARISNWLSLVEPYLLDDVEEVGTGPEVIRVTGDELAEFAARDSTRPVVETVPGAALEIRTPPFLDESLRRWSYTSIRVENDTRTTEIDVSDSHAEFDTGAHSQDDVAGDLDHGAAPDIGRYVFGEHRGATIGNFVHQVFERAVGRHPSSDVAALDALIDESARDHGIIPESGFRDVLAFLLARPMGAAFEGCSLDDFALTPHRVATEMRFTLPLVPGPSVHPRDHLPALARVILDDDPDGPFGEYFDSLAASRTEPGRLWSGYLNGSLDLVAQVGGTHDARFVIVDYKTNVLKQRPSFAPQDLYVEMGLSGYPLQALLYSVALHRFLRDRLTDYDPGRHMGGATYYYVRGAAVPGAAPEDGLVHWGIPPTALVRASDLLDGRGSS